MSFQSTMIGIVTNTKTKKPVNAAVLTSPDFVGSMMTTPRGMVILEVAGGTYDIVISHNHYVTKTVVDVVFPANKAFLLKFALTPKAKKIKGMVKLDIPAPIAGLEKACVEQATVKLLKNGLVVASQLSACDGSYSFENLEVGKYEVKSSILLGDAIYSKSSGGFSIEDEDEITMDMLVKTV